MKVGTCRIIRAAVPAFVLGERGPNREHLQAMRPHQYCVTGLVAARTALVLFFAHARDLISGEDVPAAATDQKNHGSRNGEEKKPRHRLFPTEVTVVRAHQDQQTAQKIPRPAKDVTKPRSHWTPL